MEYSEAALQKVRQDRLLIDAVDGWLFDEIAGYLGRRVLEVGCGIGNFARFLQDRELYIGTDVSAESIAFVQARFSDRENFLAYECDVTSHEFEKMARYDVDTVFSLNVFEHIEDDAGALENAVEVLLPGGNLILVVPAHGWLYGSIDKAIGHYRRYSKCMIRGLFKHAGLTCLSMKHINALGALGWFANGRIVRQETPPTGQLRLINRIVPLAKRFEQVVPMPFGISLLAVGKKPE